MSSPVTNQPDQRAHLRHELRTPLNHIIGYSEMLMEEAADRSWTEFLPDLQRVHSAGQQLLAHVNKHFAPAKSGAEKPDLRQIQHELLTPLNQIIGYTEMLQEQAEEMGRKDFLPDFLRIHTAAKNLLVIINENIRQSEKHEAERSVGIGVTSAERSGFSQPVPQRSALSLRVERGSLLVVDDDALNRDMLSRRLERLGCTVACAENGRVALEMVRAQKFDLVLLDIMMPEIDGYQVLAQLKADPALVDIPVIILSASDEVDSVVRGIISGAEDYLPKPFDPVLLRARIGACLEKKRLRDREVSYLHLIEAEKKRSDELLHVILPHDVAQELKTKQSVEPRQHENVGVLFCDVVDFTAFCDQHNPKEVWDHLQALVQAFENLATEHGLEKIKTIGDAFMATAGLLAPMENPALNCVKCGLDMVNASKALPARWQVHVGIHVGPVVAGVVGRKKYLFDIWGDTVNTAARVTGLAGPDSVFVSGSTWQMLQPLCRGHSCGLFQVKGKGQMDIFRVQEVLGKK